MPSLHIIIYVYMLSVANAGDVEEKSWKLPYSRHTSGQCSSVLKKTDRPSDRGWSHPVLGHFYRNEIYCNSRCNRKWCCFPEHLKDFKVNFFLKNDKVRDRRLKFGDKKAFRLLNEGKVVFIIHGYLNDYTRDEEFNVTRDGWVRKGANSIIVDWRKNNQLYNLGIANVRVLGAMVGQLIEFLEVAERTVCVGFSLGAHVCGEAGKWLKQRGQVLATCHGLDPAGNGYDTCSDEIKLDKTDCGVVTAIHTSDGSGTAERLGHCDFWLNNGHYQPGCRPNYIYEIDHKHPSRSSGFCNHVRAILYYNNQLWDRCSYKGFLSRDCGLHRDCILTKGPGMVMSPDDTCTSLHEHDYFVKGQDATFDYCPSYV